VRRRGVWLRLALATLAASPVVSIAAPAVAAKVHGAFVLDESVKIGEGRYQSQRDWDKTVRFFRSVYDRTSGVVWHDIATTPRVRARFLENTKRDQAWEGINLYEVDGKVFIYVIARDAAAKLKKEK
jgi:hypothetical protein